MGDEINSNRNKLNVEKQSVDKDLIVDEDLKADEDFVDDEDFTIVEGLKLFTRTVRNG